MSEIERRSTPGTIEFRAGSKGPGTLTGHAAVFGSLSRNLGGFVELVAPTAFRKSLADNLDVLARYNHEDNMLLGRVSSGTLRLSEDTTGLRYEVDLPDTSFGRDVAVLGERGDVKNSSFAFQVPVGGDEWSTTESGFPLRTLNAVRLIDVAPVNTPAYPEADAAMRSLARHLHADVDEVRKAIESDGLAALITHELPSESRSEEEDPEAQGETHATGLRVLQLRQDWLNKK